MAVRKINLDTDYEILKNWQVGHKQNIIPRSLFSDSGFMVDDVVAGFLYKTNSAICFVENFISDPSSEKNHRRAAINQLFKKIIETAKEEKFEVMFTAVILDSLRKNLEELEFKDLPKDRLMFRSLQ